MNKFNSLLAGKKLSWLLGSGICTRCYCCAMQIVQAVTKGKVSLNLEIEPFDENRVKIKHKLSYVRPTNRGKISEEDTTETPMYVNRGGRLTILQEDQGQLLTLAGEPDGKLRAAGH
ncbi:hypothetical protein [Escherichia coli]|uniref:hypothetical protein n=1 Tax=Escherichia coli TaxID=562 RepID=UPI0037BEC527